MSGLGVLARVLTCVFFLSGMVFAQVTTGTILGTVSDSTGAVIPGANVVVRNVDTGITRTVTTDSAGRFRAPQLGLGSYEVTAESTGFQTAVRTGITLTIGREATVDFTLQVGAVAERITVTGEAPLIETTNATVASLISEQQMRDIPLLGRSFTDLAALQPGVITNMGQDVSTFSGGVRLAIGGARPQQSLYLLDGVDQAVPYSNTAPTSALGETLGVDTIREFTVLQSNYGAQYGRAIGGIMNAVTRSGTNELHGSAFEFFRNSALNAKNFFDVPDCEGRDPNVFACGTKPAYKRNQFGGTIGGPIVRDNTFFFASYEGLVQRLGTTDFSTVLSDETRIGTITGCPAGLQRCTKEQRIIQEVLPLGVNPDIVPLIRMVPQASPGGLYRGDGIQESHGSRTQPGRENYFMGRIDQRLSDNDNLFGRLVYDTASKELLDEQFLDADKGLHSSTNDWSSYIFSVLEWTKIVSPQVLNIARVGFTRANLNQCLCIDAEENKRVNAEEYPNLAPQLRMAPGYFGRLADLGGAFPGVNVLGGHSGPPTGDVLGADLDDPLNIVDNTFSFSDSVRISKGSHSLDIGGDFYRYQMNNLIATWAHPSLSFREPIKNALTAGLAPYCVGPASDCRGISGSTFAVATGPNGEIIGSADLNRGWRQSYGSWYFQDDFRVLSNLTINLGVRWERVSGPWEVNGKAARYEDINRSGEWTQLGTNKLFTTRDGLKGFSPRFGFAYSLNQKTSVRGGVGTFKEMPLQYLYQLAQYYPPYSFRKTVNDIKAWPNPLFAAAASIQHEPLIAVSDYKVPAGYQWNFGMERQLAEQWVVKASYIGTRGANLVATLNQVQPAVLLDANGERFTPRGAPTLNPDKTMRSTRTYNPIGDSWYNALQLQLQKRLSHGFQMSPSYTWSKTQSTAGSGLKGAEAVRSGGRGQGVGDLWDFKGRKSLADQDARHNFTLNFSWELPIGQGRSFGSQMGSASNAILGGWQINGVFKGRSGLPASIGGAGYSNTQYCRSCTVVPMLKPGGDNNPVTGNIDHWFDETQFLRTPAGYFGNVGANTLSQPRLIAVDFSAFKVVPVGENKNLQFRWEVFNVANHPFFAGPNASVFQSNGSVNPSVGIIGNTRTGGRQMQLALKFEF
ncbi:MAG: TonB-dependent receptor [Acidobacteria bacterium]|nr:TonB-dependent receptor [Acidobacteriota bacterium]